jgi:hypothetical protein
LRERVANGQTERLLASHVLYRLRLT